MAAKALSYDELLAKMQADFGPVLAGLTQPLKDMLAAAQQEIDALKSKQTDFMARLEAGRSPADPTPTETAKGITFARVTRALAASKGNASGAVDWIRRNYGKDDRAAKALESSEDAKTKIRELAMQLKAPQLASDFETGGVFIQPEFAQDFIEVLRPQSVVQSLNPVFAPLNSGTMAWPKITSQTNATYVGEGTNAPKTGIGTGQLILTARKISAIVPISNDLLRFGSINADTVVRDDLAREVRLLADARKIRGLGTQHSPRGLRYWAPAGNLLDLSAGNATPSLAIISDALEELRYRLVNNNVGMIRPGWIFAPRIEKVIRGTRDGHGSYVWRSEMDQGRLLGYPFRVTTQVPITLGSGTETEITIADFADAIDAEAEGIILDASREAMYIDGGVAKSSFQEDSTVVRVLMLHDFGMRHDESVAVATGVKWTTAPVG